MSRYDGNTHACRRGGTCPVCCAPDEEQPLCPCGEAPTEPGLKFCRWCEDDRQEAAAEDAAEARRERDWER